MTTADPSTSLAPVRCPGWYASPGPRWTGLSRPTTCCSARPPCCSPSVGHGPQRLQRLLLPAERRRLLSSSGQLVWVLVGIPCAFVASRLPLRHVRRLAWPALLVAIVLLALVRPRSVSRSTATRTGWAWVRS